MANKQLVISARVVFDEEIAKFASRSITEDGQQLYEGLINYSNDENEVTRLLTSAMNNLVAQFSDIIVSAEYTPNVTGSVTIIIANPDHPTSWVKDSNDLAEFIAIDALTNWMIKRSRRNEAEILSAERNEIVTRLRQSLYKRTPITRA